MGTGYTRNDTANNIADGNVINASDLDGEFDAVQAAFNGSTGHSHDGTSGEGPQIAAGGLASNAVTTAKILDANVTTAKINNGAVTSAKLDTNIQIAGTLGVTGETTLTTHLNMGDNDIIKLGASSDLQISHTGSASDIKETGTGNLRIWGDDIQFFNSAGSKYYAQMITDGAVTLYYNGADKLATTSTGIDVTGNIVVSGNVDGRNVAGDGTKLDGIESGATADQSASEILTLIKTVDGAGSGLDADTLDGVSSASFLRSDAADTKTSGDLSFSDNVKAQFGASNDLQIFHNGSNSVISDGGTGNLNIQANNLRLLNAGATENYIQCDLNGEVRLYYDNAEKLNTKSDGVLITGELEATTLDINGNADISGNLIMGGNVDLQDNDSLRIGTGDDLQIFHDGSNSYITQNTTGNLYIRQNRDDGDIFIQSDNGSGGTTNYLIADGSTGKTLLHQYGSEKLRTESDGIYVTGNVQSSTGQFEGASNADRINIEASNINYYINGNNEFRMEADGDFHADGDVIAFSTTVSDERLKTDIEKIENATDKVSQLNGYTFTYKADGKKSAGVIAQEVEKVLPSAVSEKELPLKMDDGVAYKTVQYDQIIGLLIESIKELKQEINELRGN